MNLTEVRAKVPELQGLDDATALRVLHETYYPDLSIDDLSSRLGYKTTAPKETAGVMRTAGDVGIKVAQGVVDLGQSAVGAASLATGGLAGKAMRAIGYDPERTNAALGEYLSEDQRSAEQAVQGAEGFGDTLQAALMNPRAIAGSVAESVPGMLGIGGLTKMVAQRIALKAAAPFGGMATAEGAAAAQKAIEAATTRLLITSGATEGAQSAGQIADQAQAAGRDYADYALPAIGSGVATGAITLGAGKLAGDATTALFSGSKSAGAQGASRLVRVAKSAGSEGVLQEGPQSGIEQMMTNLAMGRPFDEGVGNATAMGVVTGAAMGAGEGAIAPHHAQQKAAADTVRATETVPEVGPLSAAANLATEGKAQSIENAPPAPAQPAEEPMVDPIVQRIQRLTGGDKQDALHAYAVINREDVAKGVRQYNSRLLDQLLKKAEASPQPQVGVDTADLLASNMGRDPVQGALADQRDEETTRQNLAKWMERAEQLPLDRAQELQAAASDRGLQMEVVPHGSGQGFTVVPAEWVAPSMRNQTGAMLPLATEPTGTVRVDSTGTAAPETEAQAIDTRATLAAQEAERQAKADIGLTPDVEAAQRTREASQAAPAASSPSKEAATPASPPSSPGSLQPADITSKSGKPFATKLPASNAAKRAGDGHEVVPVEGGFVVRKKAAPEWEAFPDHTGSLKIPRADMPQIKSEHHGPLVNFLNARGVAHETVEVDPATLKPTQAEYSPAKVEAIAKAAGERSILVSSDGHVIDGHHQWLGAGAEDKTVKVIRLDAPVAKLLPLIKEFPSAESADAAATPAAQPERTPDAAVPAQGREGQGDQPAADVAAGATGEAEQRDGALSPAEVAKPEPASSDSSQTAVAPSGKEVTKESARAPDSSQAAAAEDGATQEEKVRTVVELRKQVAVLRSLKKCLGGA